jgi:hypothetical protein
LPQSGKVLVRPFPLVTFLWVSQYCPGKVGPVYSKLLIGQPFQAISPCHRFRRR